MTLKNVLKSRVIVKGFWDARNDAAGLFHEFGIKLNGSGVVDVQLVIWKSTSFKYQYNRPRLDEAINVFCKMSNEVTAKMTNIKEAGKRMWKPALGGSFDVFAERPL
jgi:exonuclease 3'-5' domain-containing protein 1